MSTKAQFGKCKFLVLIVMLIVFTGNAIPATSSRSQFGGLGKTLDSGLCAFGGYGLSKVSQKIAEVETRRLKLPLAAAAAQQRQFQIGLAMALCNGGKSISNTLFARMSEKDKKQRTDDIDTAVADSAPTTQTVPLPDHPEIKETISTDPIVADGGRECRTIKDYLADQGQGDTALVKYCRKPPDGQFEVATL
jgi:hypothetical protein